MGIARLIRSKALQERELDYVNASKTMGSSDLKIMFTQVLPNLSSIIIVTMTLNLAANIGLESGLSFLGFGFPEETPSLGTLLSYSTDPQTLEYRWWVWLPAGILILVLMLAVNNVGQALKRATDARQRKGSIYLRPGLFTTAFTYYFISWSNDVLKASSYVVSYLCLS